MKPGNLFLTAGGVVKLLDLGLARLVPDPAESEDTDATTREGAVLGTPDFMAPEQLRDAGAVDTRADIYSLGCTLYALLAGRAPFAGGSPAEKMAKHLSAEDPVPIESLRPDAPPALVVIIRKMLAKRPEDRYQTPGEVVAALAALLAALPAASRAVTPAGATDLARAPRQRRRIAVGALALLAAVALALVGWRITRPNSEAKGDPLRAEGPSTAAPPSKPEAPPDDPDRRAVELLRPHKFAFTVQFANGTKRALTHNDNIPVERFAVSGIMIDAGTPPFEAGFVHKTFLPAVRDLRQLVEIRDYGGTMTWAEDDLARLAGAPGGALIWRFESDIPLAPRSLAALKRFPS